MARPFLAGKHRVASSASLREQGYRLAAVLSKGGVQVKRQAA